MIITQSRWRKWLGLPYIRVQAEWLEELCEMETRPQVSAGWVGGYEEYRWSQEIKDWLAVSGGDYRVTPGYNVRDFALGCQASIWFRHMRNVTLFKLTFGGQARPKNEAKFQIVKKTIQVKSRKLNATWTIEPPTLIKQSGLDLT